MKTIYRVSDIGYPKNKLPLVNNENCFVNFCANFLRCDLANELLNYTKERLTTDCVFNSIAEKIV